MAASGQIQMAADTAVDEFGWRVHRVPAELPSPSSLPASLAELRCDWEAWLADSDIPVGTPFLISPRFEYDVALNAFFSSVEMVAAPRTTQEGYARDVAAFLTFLWTSAPATGRPRDPVHAAGQGRLDDPGGDHPRGPGGRPAAAGGRNGEIVAAQLDRSGTAAATVKTLQRLDGHVWLMPHNPAYQPIPADDATILGKVVAVVRPA